MRQQHSHSDLDRLALVLLGREVGKVLLNGHVQIHQSSLVELEESHGCEALADAGNTHHCTCACACACVHMYVHNYFFFWHAAKLASFPGSQTSPSPSPSPSLGTRLAAKLIFWGVQSGKLVPLKQTPPNVN